MKPIDCNRPNIYIMGFMGSGKTKIGSLLARKLNRPFWDTDAKIVEESGMSIVEIFDKEGESGFRLREKDLIERISKLNGNIVSLGGGTILNPENWLNISQSGITVSLSYPPEIIDARLERKKDRPLLNQFTGAERIQRIASLLEARNPYYRKADVILHFNKEVAPEQVVEALSGYLGVKP